MELSGGAERQPRFDGVITAVLRPVALQGFDVDFGRLSGEHALRTDFGHVANGGAFEIENAARSPEEGGDLLALNFSDGCVVRENRENRNQSVLPELRYVINVGVDDCPGDASGNRSVGDLGHTRTYRLSQYGIGTIRRILDEA